MIKEQMDKLVAELAEYDYQYHTLDSPTIPDSIYDKIYVELKTLEQQYPEYIHPNSPTQRIGCTIQKGFKQVIHEVPFYSLDKVYTDEELAHWMIGINKQLIKKGDLDD